MPEWKSYNPEGFMKDELTMFNAYLDEVFGKDMMPICKGYVDYLKKNN